VPQGDLFDHFIGCAEKSGRDTHLVSEKGVIQCPPRRVLGAQNTVERDVKAAPGKEARVAVYTDIKPDCTSGPLPAIRLASPPAHGAVTIKRGTLKVTNYKQCLATEVPVFRILSRRGQLQRRR
jgi:hypothetical protein